MSREGGPLAAELQVNLERCILRNFGPAKGAISQGIASLKLLPEVRLSCC